MSGLLGVVDGTPPSYPLEGLLGRLAEFCSLELVATYVELMTKVVSQVDCVVVADHTVYDHHF